jgi:alkylation response protein AidB-like acyl-CoA dehydrogenase
MGHFMINEKDIFFVLKDQLNYGSLCKFERYRDLNEKMLDSVVTEAINWAKGLIDPLQEIGEKWGEKFEGRNVCCPSEFKEAFRQHGQGGWLAASRDLEYGGQGFPHMMRIVINDFMYGACQAFNMASSLTHGAAHLIESFATENLARLYLRKMYLGEWAGTMCLTEPDAGSHLAGIQTTAYREGDHFKIKGLKTLISWGDHDLTENIIHLVLARIDGGSPDGVKGLSLFIVPKIRVRPDGSLGDLNDVICERVEKKLGLHASPTCELSFGSHDACIAYLCGEENRGLAHMFQMMNESRINTGVSGMTLASTAYQNALFYARERVQGSDLKSRKPGYVLIIEHPDVRRMLLWMKATVDGMRSMIYAGAFWLDLALEMPPGEERKHYQALTDFMTPIIKAYCSEMGFRVCETAIQCLGGYGYCKEYPLEQYLRDSKIMSLYEGTNGIQSIDLMGRKMRINEGAPFRAFIAEIERFCQKNKRHPTLGKHIQFLSRVAERLFKVAKKMSDRAKSDPLQWASYTYPALLCFGDVTTAWLLLDMAVISQRYVEEGKESDFYVGKVLQANYFTETTLPLTLARANSCVRRGREILEMSQEAF